MKKKIKIILSMQLAVIIMCSIFIHTVYATESSVNSFVNLSLNANAMGYVSPGNEITYFFTAPESGFYTVETSGTTDVYGTVTISDDGTTNTYSDDNSGVDFNFAIGFYIRESVVASIHVRHRHPMTGSGSFGIQVRRQKARIYTGYYPPEEGQTELDTTPDAVQPNIYLNFMGYEVGNYQNVAANHVRTFDSNFRRINSEIFFFSGHGDKSLVMFPIPYYSTENNVSPFPERRLRSFEMIHDNLSMNNTKVALWASCYSAAELDELNPSMIQASVNLGAETAVGFEHTISPSSSRQWSNRFFYALADGYSVTGAGSFANFLLVPWDSCRQYLIAGSPYNTINTPNVNPKASNANSSNTSQQELYEQFEQDQSEFNYTLFEDHGMKQYFKTINGIITNDFYAIMEDGKIIKSSETINQETINHILSDIKQEKINFNLNKKVKNEIIEDSITFNKLVSSENHIIFFQKNGIITPIKIIYSDYESQDGYTTRDVECINLLDGSNVDYETLTFDYEYPV